MINFDETTHTYSRNGNIYTSVTTLLANYKLSANYNNIPKDVLNKAAQRGKEVHKMLEEYIKNGVLVSNPDFENFIKYISNRNIDCATSLSEAIIYDDTFLIAGTVDWQYYDGDNFIIADFKTTSQIHWDAVTWQLSIYNYIICKGDILQYYINKLKVIHLYNGKFSVRELPTIDYDEVTKLLTANLSNQSYTYVPDFSKILSNSEEYVLDTILEDIANCKALLKELTQKEEEMKKKLVERMKTQNLHECEFNNFKVKYTDTISRKVIDTEKLKTFCEISGVDVNTFYKQSASSEKLTITKK